MLLVMFKSSEEPQEDPYLLAVQSSFPSVRAVILSPQAFRPCRRQHGDGHVDGNGDDWDVVLFTSQRAVQFYAELWPERLRRQLQRWPAAICYAVGPATAGAAAAVGFPEVRGGARCGSAAALCDLVASELQQPGEHLILFPCGRTRKDTVEARLAGAGGFQIAVLEVYEAAEKDCLAAELDCLLSSEDAATSGESPLLLAFFSPSSASMVLRHFNWHGRSVKFIAIGPSTSERLRQLHVPETSCLECAAPTVDALLAALSQCT